MEHVDSMFLPTVVTRRVPVAMDTRRLTGSPHGSRLTLLSGPTPIPFCAGFIFAWHVSHDAWHMMVVPAPCPKRLSRTGAASRGQRHRPSHRGRVQPFGLSAPGRSGTTPSCARSSTVPYDDTRKGCTKARPLLQPFDNHSFAQQGIAPVP